MGSDARSLRGCRWDRSVAISDGLLERQVRLDETGRDQRGLIRTNRGAEVVSDLT